VRPLRAGPPLLLAALLLAACGAAPQRQPQPDADQDAPHLKEAEIHADLIQQMLDNGQYYAALAHVQEEQRSSGPSEQLTLLEADARGHLDQRAAADALYRQLLQGSRAAAAYHGLGRLYVEANLDSAIRYFKAAVERAPTDVDFRNDLGYALMNAGRYTEAQAELSTAVELAPSQTKARNNLIVLMMLRGNDSAVQQLAQDAALPPAKLQDLRRTAQSIRDQQTARAAKPAPGKQ
jgi:Flp pilus assembly protein TadD